ncbi:hypothetical protein APHAL10511_004223 [Amanita phalloides]|nr:hypothetical protein APHAL10511_004223 [Amanita phalloides]
MFQTLTSLFCAARDDTAPDVGIDVESGHRAVVCRKDEARNPTRLNLRRHTSVGIWFSALNKTTSSLADGHIVGLAVVVDEFEVGVVVVVGVAEPKAGLIADARARGATSHHVTVTNQSTYLSCQILFDLLNQGAQQEVFFGGPLPDYTGPADFLEHQDRVQGLEASSLALIKRLDLAMKIVDSEESAVDDFAAELLRAMRYETEQTVIRTRKNIRLNMCGEQVHAKTDICVLDADSEILLLAQEDKSHINPQDPEPLLVAEAIAAFQANNAIRVNDLFLEPLESVVLPGITMSGTFPRFYKIRVTTELNYCVRHGLYPSTETIIYRHTPRVPRRRTDGMRPLGVSSSMTAKGD